MLDDLPILGLSLTAAATLTALAGVVTWRAFRLHRKAHRIRVKMRDDD